MARLFVSKRRMVALLCVISLLFVLVYHRSHAAPSSSRLTSRWSSTSSQRPVSVYPAGIQPSKLVVSIAGFSHFENLYVKNGTVYLLSSPGAAAYDPIQGGGGGFVDVNGVELLPRRQITSTGLASMEPFELREATENEITVLPWEDRSLLELDIRQPLQVAGTTIWIQDSGDIFLDHYYHLWVELILGAWKSLVIGVGGSEDKTGYTTVAFPSRIVFPNAVETDWRDNAKINGYLLKTIFPSLAYEHRDDFDERIATGKTYLYERVVLVDRTAGSQGSKSTGPAKWYWKMVGDILDAPVTPHWFEPIRRRLLDTLPPIEQPTAPTITYISRQGHGRSLRDADHSALVQALGAMATRRGWNLEIPKMQTMSKDEQFALAAKTTIMLGVHGNGLSHQLWMEPSPFSTVIEMYDQGGFSYDYALPAQALGHRHYAAWLSGMIDTETKVQAVEFTAGFHGRDIRQNAQTIVDLIERRLEGWKP